MKDIRAEKVIRYLDNINRQRKQCTSKYGWIENVKYIEQIQTISMLMWLIGAIDHPEYKSLLKRYKATSKDMRKAIHINDLELMESTE